MTTDTLTMTTDSLTGSPLVRARAESMLRCGARAHAADLLGVVLSRDVSHADQSHVDESHVAEPHVDETDAAMFAAAAYVPAATTTRIDATTIATNPWLGGFGSGEGTGICPTTVVGESTKRIRPGRLEGMT